MSAKILIKDVQNFINKEGVNLAFIAGGGANGRLMLRYRGGFEVWEDDKLVLETPKLNKAVNKLNSLELKVRN